jgi:predicted transport protein
MGHVETMARKHYILFKNGKSFVNLNIRKSRIRVGLVLKSGELDDSRGLARDLSFDGKQGWADYYLTVSPGDDLEYPLFLIGQAHKNNSGQ